MEGTFLARSRPRQQRRPGAPSLKEEDAARRRLPGDETAKLLREAFGAGEPRKVGGGAKAAQARAQEGAARRSHCRSEEESLAGARARATARDGRRSSAAARSILKRAATGSAAPAIMLP